MSLGLRLVLHNSRGGVANLASESGKRISKAAGGLDDVAEPVTEGTGPLGAPSVVVSCVLWPTEALFQGAGNMLQFEPGIGGAIPIEYVKNGDFGSVGIPMEMGKGDLTAVVFAEGRDENQISWVPTPEVGGVGRSALLNDEGVEDAAQDDDGETSPAELDEKMPKG